MLNTLGLSTRSRHLLSCVWFGLVLVGCVTYPAPDFLNPGHLPYLKKSRLIQVSSNDTSGGNFDAIAIKPGETKVLADIDGPGVIVRIWVTISSQDEHFLRRILLRMYWDDEKHPSVEVPVGDFFGSGFAYTHYMSYFLGMSSGGYYSYFPMPFGRRARIEVVNETGSTVPSFYYHIDYQKPDDFDEEMLGYFHAQWRREARTTQGSRYLVLAAKGEGHFVGMNLQMQGYRDKNLWFLEGDEFIYVDGEEIASIRGTGTEDYFTGGWYFNKGPFAGPFHGVVAKDDTLLSRVVAYRFHLGDQIPFSSSIRFEIEHGHANEEPGDYASVAYWYQKDPHEPFEPILPAAQRIPLRVAVPYAAIEGESLVETADVKNGSVEAEDMSGFGADWSGNRQLLFRAAGPDCGITISFPATSPDKYLVTGYFTAGPSYGRCEVWTGETQAASFDGYRATVMPHGRVDLGSMKIMEGEGSITLKVVGKNPKSSGFDAGLDALILTPDRDFIREWNVIGPFDNPGDSQKREGLRTEYGPERDLDIGKTHTGAEGRNVGWKSATARRDGFVDLNPLFEANDNVVAYALAYVRSPSDRRETLYIGSDDGVRVFVNGVMVHDNPVLRGASPDQDTVAVNLRTGWNSVLLKVEENLGGWGFFARIPNINDDLAFSTGSGK